MTDDLSGFAASLLAVAMQVEGVAELLLAGTALVLLDAQVQVYVSAKVTSLSESLIAALEVADQLSLL